MLHWILYKNPYHNCFFTNYISSEIFMEDNKVVFLPTKILLQDDSLVHPASFSNEITIEYKSIVFYPQKK